MKIAILSRAASSYSTRRLVEATIDRGHEPDLIDIFKLSISLERGLPSLFYDGHPLPDYDAVIPRIGASLTYFGTAAVQQFEQMQVFCANSSSGIAWSRDKLRCLQLLSRHDIGMPPTAFVRRSEDVLPAIERLGGAPVIIKLLEGTQGVGVILAETTAVASAIIETLQTAKQNVLIQKFVSESKGRDVRAFVVGDRVVAAARRVAKAGEFRSNVHRGGRAEAVTLDETYEATAVRAAQIVGLRVAGVDMLEGSDGPAVMEVNSSPGLEGIEGATGIDVAGAVIDYIEEHVQFPELDIAHKLRVSRGYGVAELPIGELSVLIGKTIVDSGLREEDILVLTLHREGRVIANPRRDRVIQSGDRLLCFGKLDRIKGFLPEHDAPRVLPLDTAIPHGDGSGEESAT
ncbi:MAG: RimK family alpha-L-glutamate ligase [Thermoleophilia bacterium]|nr:RimK family alpha-L-glutamate ligase [Thermoleophilia bacterium]